MAQERSKPKRESPQDIAKKKTSKDAEPKAAAKKPAAAKAEAKKPAAKKPAAKPKATEKPKRRTPGRRRSAEAAPKETSKAAISRPVVHAHAKYVRSSARKARLVIDHIRGKPVDVARATLRHSSRGVSTDIQKLLESAIANAENNHELVADDLLVKEISADEGPTLRRFRPRAQGRATRIRKRTAHLSIALTTKE
jgi:ribosomal protein L22